MVCSHLDQFYGVRSTSRRLLLLAAPLLAAAQNADRIQAVEAGLTGPVSIKGRPAVRFTLAERMKALGVNGVSIAVIDNYQVAWTKGYGLADAETKRPATADTLFLAGSISKPVAATAALQLVEQGKLKLDEDVNRYLKSWQVPASDFSKEQKVTLRRLMSHMAGLTVHGFPGYKRSVPVPSVPQILDGIKPANTPAVRVDMVPGSQWRYSGGGYTVMQLIMTDVTNMPFPELMRHSVLAKAGMRLSTFENPPPTAREAETAAGYLANGNVVDERYHLYPEMAAAGLWTTAADLARFAIAIQNAYRGQPNAILKQATAQEMLTVAGGTYGLGFGIGEKEGVKRFSHGGTDVGFQAVLQAGVDGRGVVVMTNSLNGARLASEIVQSVAIAYGWPDKPREREAITMSAEALSKFAGTYQGARIGTVKVRVEGDHLSAVIPSIGDVALYPLSADTFFSLGGVPDLKFATDGSSFTGGNVTAKRVPVGLDNK